MKNNTATMKFSTTLLFLFLFILPTMSMAAEGETLWTTGKIHVVLGVLLTILVLIFVFLIVLERKISRLEKT